MIEKFPNLQTYHKQNSLMSLYVFPSVRILY